MLFFSTGKSDLDNLLGGGIASGHISMIRGETGSGKTMLLSSILSSTPCPVLHFLTEQEEPKYISMNKDEYTFVHTNDANVIKGVIIKAWNNGFGGLIAVDCIDRLDVTKGECINNPGIRARLLTSWLRWFVEDTPERPDESRLDVNVSAMILTAQVQRDGIFGVTSSGVSRGVSHMNSQVLDIQPKSKEKTIRVNILKNKFIKLSSECCEFNFDKNGIK